MAVMFVTSLKPTKHLPKQGHANCDFRGSRSKSMNVEKFKSDHAAVLGQVSDLRQLVHAGVKENAESIAKMIVAMSSNIKLHLSTEDQMLYPTLIASGKPAAVELARKFQTEMGSIATAYGEFSRKWNLGTKVSADPEGFRAEAGQIFKALHERIQRENKELYPAAEAV
jgi:iron-sulfur cluster repair protein YtfE (RIC family)